MKMMYLKTNLYRRIYYQAIKVNQSGFDLFVVIKYSFH